MPRADNDQNMMATFPVDLTFSFPQVSVMTSYCKSGKLKHLISYFVTVIKSCGGLAFHSSSLFIEKLREKRLGLQ